MNLKRWTLIVMTAALVFAGPPLICERINIGNAKSLPWKAGDGWQGADPAYDIKKVTVDTLALLTPQTPVEVRMETMRRAAIYAAQDPRISEELALRLTSRVLDSGGKSAAAWFDAGYFVETVRQASHIYKWDMLSASEKAKWKTREGITGLDGRAWVKHAKMLGEKGVDTAIVRMAD